VPPGYDERDYLLLSGIQHYAFCARQWSLIHIEGQWGENLLTFEGRALHAKVDGGNPIESRGGLVVCRSVPLASKRLGLIGKADVVEFHQCPDDAARGCVALPGREGCWRPYPVEYKRGRPKPDERDAVQLCAQALCLEEMLGVPVAEGAIYYGRTRRRQVIPLDDSLRLRVAALAKEMHAVAARGRTPPHPRRVKGCARCSLSECCVPRIRRARGVQQYMAAELAEREDAQH
jgi:CRISPR-associated exonuclease Cas4